MSPAPTLTLLAILSLAACGGNDAVTQPAVVTEGPELSPNQTTASARWMALTATLTDRRSPGQPLAWSRTFALVAVAQYDAAVSAGTSTAAKRPSEAGAVSSASAAVLASIYPSEQAAIDAQVVADRAYFPAFESERTADFAAGENAGLAVATAVIARAAADRTNAVWTGTVPVGPGMWINAPTAQPYGPLWGESRPWLLTSGRQFRPAAPPVFNSTEFQSALTEVRALTDGRTAAQLLLAQFWGAGGSGPAGPPGYFSGLATTLAATDHLNERKTARVFAVLHMAIMDASIACFDAKYAYWYVRPFQVDAAITTPVGRPNFPAYPSGHSCLSGAAASVLSGLFPSAKASMDAAVQDAGLSRIYAGLHYRFDVTVGQQLGAQVGALALTKVPQPNATIPLN